MIGDTPVWQSDVFGILRHPTYARILLLPEVAAQLRVDVSTVRRMIRRGELRASKVGGQVRVAQTWVDDMLERGTVQAPAPQASASRRAGPPSPPPSRGPSGSGTVRDRIKRRRTAA